MTEEKYQNMGDFLTFKYLSFLLLGMLMLIGLYLSSLYNYLLFHSLAEIFSIIIACGIFMIAWNSRQFLNNNYLLFIGVAYLFVGGVDLIHTLSYKGMGVFKGYETNLPTQLWISGRYMESLSLLSAPLFFRRRLNTKLVFLAYSFAILLLLLSIFSWEIFPICFIEGKGLTPFKKDSEYIISLILLTSIVLLLKHRKDFDRIVLQWVVGSIALTVASELAFTFYVNAYGFSNLVGHYFKILSFYFIYKAIIETGLSKPYHLLFRDLRQSEEMLRQRTLELQQLTEVLEERVDERTEELARANESLRHLSSRLLSAQEEERKRIAGDLHDTIGACLAAIKFKVEYALQQIGRTTPLATESLNTIIPVIQEGVEECRRIQVDLRPSILDDLGLLATFSWFCRRFQSLYTEIHVQQETAIEESEIPDTLKIVVYRITQEAMNNIAKHSKADLVRLSLRKIDGKMELLIEDNGRGFDLGKIFVSESSKKGLGLTSMRERTELSGGFFKIEVGEGKGTIIRASWSLY